MRTCALRLIIIMLAILVLTAQGFGWGEDGHRIVGEIAWRHLSEKAKAGVKDLLGDESLADACVWADIIKSDPAYDYAKPLHYVNIPRISKEYDAKRDCPEGICVVEAIKKYIAVLKDPSSPRPVQVEALKFLAHFVGDIHQPLHVAYADDRGGNMIRVTFFGEETNLHAVWDTGMLRKLMVDGWLKHAEALNSGITPGHVEEWNKFRTPELWAAESFWLVRESVYEDIPLDNALGDRYLKAHDVTVNCQLSRAGVRLAAVLNDIFENWKPPSKIEPAPTTPEVDPLQPLGSPAAPSIPEAPPTNPRPGGGFGGGGAAEPAAPQVVGEAGPFVSIVKGSACGNAGGHEMFVLNTHADQSVRVKVRKSILFEGTRDDDEITLTVKPGESARRLLGCSAARIRKAGTRTIEWTLLHAEFVDKP